MPRRAVSAAAALLVAGCGRGPPERALTWRETWELLAFTDRGEVVDVEGGATNRDLLRGQGWIAAAWWSPRQTPIRMVRRGAPEQVELADTHDFLHVGRDFVGRRERGEALARWSARLATDDSTIVAHLDAGGPPAEPAAWIERGGQWRVEAPVTHGRLSGWVEAPGRGGPLTGHGAVLHRGGDGWPAGARLTAVVLGSDLALGVHLEGRGRLAWAAVEGHLLDVSDSRIEWTPGERTARIDLRPAADLVARLRLRRVGGQRDLLAALSPPERALVRWVAGDRARVVRGAMAHVRWRGRVLPAPALLVYEGPREAP